MAMDRAEMIGLGVAVAGHVALLGLFALGLMLSEEKIEKPQAISVTLDGPGSPLPVTGDIGDIEPVEEPAPADVSEAAEADEAESEAAEAEAEARRLRAAATAANASAAEKARAKKAAEAAAKKRREAEKAARKKREAERKRRAEEERKRKEREAERRRKEFEKRMGKTLGGGGDNAPSAGAARKARATIGGQIRIRDCPPGIDVSKIITRVTINLNRNGSIKSLTNISQSGRTPSNAPQMAPTQRCIINSIRAAEPFSGLDASDYQSWKSIRISFKAN